MWESFGSYYSFYPKGYSKLSGVCHELNKYYIETIKFQDIFSLLFFSAPRTAQGILNFWMSEADEDLVCGQRLGLLD